MLTITTLEWKPLNYCKSPKQATFEQKPVPLAADEIGSQDMMSHEEDSGSGIPEDLKGNMMRRQGMRAPVQWLMNEGGGE